MTTVFWTGVCVGAMACILLDVPARWSQRRRPIRARHHRRRR